MKERPKSAILAVTNRCDGRCIMCNIWKEGRSGEISPDVYNQLPESLETVNVTGGEPFLREDLPDIINVINERCHNPRIIISSNGFRTEAINKQMKVIKDISKNVGVRISIDGIGPVHEKIRGIKEGYQKCLNTIKALKSIPIEDLGISFTILSQNGINNISEISKVYDLSRDLDVEFTITTAINSEIYFKKDSNTPVSATKEIKNQLEYVISHELKSCSLKRLIRSYYTKGLHDFITGIKVLNNCGAGASFFFLTAHGELYPCHLLNSKCADINEGSFHKIWYSKSGEEMRNIALHCPHKCWMTCTVKPYFKRHMFGIIAWIIKSKFKAHMGMKIL